MKFKIDENLGPQVRDRFVREGYDALTVHDQCASGIADPDLVRLCTSEGRTLVTMDKELANVVMYPPGSHAGVILLRIMSPTPEHELALVVPRLLANLKVNDCRGATWVATTRGVHIYSLRSPS